MSSGTIMKNMASIEQKKKLLKAKIAVALQDELGRVPKKTEAVGCILTAGREGKMEILAYTPGVPAAHTPSRV
jgi:hypothetical protein